MGEASVETQISVKKNSKKPNPQTLGFISCAVHRTIRFESSMWYWNTREPS